MRPLLYTFVLALFCGSLPAAARARETINRGGTLRERIKSTLFAPEPLPALATESYGLFEPEPGVAAERVSYTTQFGMRVLAILYLPKQRSGKIPALIVVNGHGGDKYSWYAFYAGILYARAASRAS